MRTGLAKYDLCGNNINLRSKRFKSLPQTQIFNPYMLFLLDISNLDYLILQNLRSTTSWVARKKKLEK